MVMNVPRADVRLDVGIDAIAVLADVATGHRSSLMAQHLFAGALAMESTKGTVRSARR